jgi:hypothetical protein
MLQIMRDGTNSPEFDQGMAALRSGRQPGHYSSWDEMSAPLWPIPPVLN